MSLQACNVADDHGPWNTGALARQAALTSFTVNLAERSGTLLVNRIDDSRNAVRTVKRGHPFDILAWVVLPDHLHAIWRLPEDGGDCATRWMLIKAGFFRKMPMGKRIRAAGKRKGERGIWQRRFWEHLITDEDDFRTRMNYVQINPVKHRHVMRASEWPYSSIHRYIRAGWMTEDWAVPVDGGLEAGER